MHQYLIPRGPIVQPRTLRDWLLAQEPNRYVGDMTSRTDCVIARFLRESAPGWRIAIGYRGGTALKTVGWLPVPIFVPIRLAPWVAEYIHRCVDHINDASIGRYGCIDRLDALAVLNDLCPVAIPPPPPPPAPPAPPEEPPTETPVEGLPHTWPQYVVKAGAVGAGVAGCLLLILAALWR